MNFILEISFFPRKFFKQKIMKKTKIISAYGDNRFRGPVQMGKEGGVDVEEDNREGGNHSHHHQRQELQHEVPGCNERLFYFDPQMRIILYYFLKK
jgi:hypothetical protein